MRAFLGPGVCRDAAASPPSARICLPHPYAPGYVPSTRSTVDGAQAGECLA